MSRLSPGVWVKEFQQFAWKSKTTFLDSDFVPSWLTKGRAVLLQKDKSKGNIASNYRPISCLPLMQKLQSDVIPDQIYGHIDQQDLLPEEQEGCKERPRGTTDLLYIDGAVIREVK